MKGDGQRVMSKRNKYRQTWEVIGGCIEPGETPRECAERESLEESGYEISDLRFVGLIKCFLVTGYPSAGIDYAALYCADIDNIKIFRKTKKYPIYAGIT